MRNFLSNIFNWQPVSRQEVEAITEEAELAERSIEARLENVAEKLKRGKFGALEQRELDELAEDLEKILEFVEHAITVLEGSGHLQSIDASLHRLKWVRTRIQNIRREQENLAASA